MPVTVPKPRLRLLDLDNQLLLEIPPENIRQCRIRMTNELTYTDYLVSGGPQRVPVCSRHRLEIEGIGKELQGRLYGLQLGICGGHFLFELLQGEFALKGRCYLTNFDVWTSWDSMFQWRADFECSEVQKCPLPEQQEAIYSLETSIQKGRVIRRL